MKNLMIYGASYPDIIQLVDLINNQKKIWNIIGFLDDVKYGHFDKFMNHPILGGEAQIKEYSDKGCYFINNVFGTTRNRLIVSTKLDKLQVCYASLIAPTCNTSYAQVGYDCVIMDGAKLGANVSIGNHVAIRFNSIVNHDNQIDAHAFIAPGVTLSGHVKIGEGAYIGAGAVIKEKINIGPWSIIGAGAVVVRDVNDGDSVAGVPAKPIHS